jgi:type I restriction enzyme S subunit
MDGGPCDVNHRVKAVCREVDVRAGLDQPPLLSVSIHRGVVPRTDLTDAQSRAEDLSNYKLCEAGDIVLNRMRAFQGAIGISRRRGLVSPDYLVLRPRLGVEARYLHYTFRSDWFVSMMISRLRGIGSTDQGNVRTPRINADDLLDIGIAIPDLEEQRRIADFLDDQVARIENIIAARKAQAGLVRESGSHVLLDVARSLGAHEMSPLPWFNAWREGWTIQRLSWLVRCLDGRRVPLNGSERGERQGPFPYYGASTIVDYIDGYIFDGDYVLVGEDGAALENPNFDVVQRVSGKVWVNNHAHVLEATQVEADYLAYFMRCVDRPLLISGATRPKITQEDLLALPVVVPPRDERDRMSAICAQRVIENETALGFLARSVDSFEELKRSLITAAVTGHFDVSSADGSRVPA